MSNEKKAEVPFVFSGGTLASEIAEQICKQGSIVLEKVNKEEEPKPTAT